MFEKLLIANRGEIACRIVKTARRLGIYSIAVYSEADVDALHVHLADEARLVGAAPARASYLNIDAIVRAARAAGAEAIHPGYGFLAENADFAEACTSAGLAFVGPPAQALRAMGSKRTAKALMAQANVPVVPGYHGEDQTKETLRAQAERIGYPVLIKPSAGGGGKGMRVVEDASDFDSALAAAQREAANAFGDDEVLLEKWLNRARHIEIQIFCDTYGHAVHLFERDCSIQRRHQKIIEEAPAPGMITEQRTAMGKRAIDAATAIGYLGAGTVEFIVDTDGGFYFMEMNTRLQVEHPVTEMITGQDLVDWQLRVAAGEALPYEQDALALRGHAIEVRIYAEDPARDFVPATGQLRHLHLPSETARVRVDSGVRQGDVVSVHYDPLLAKLIVWDADRTGALRRLRAALAQTRVLGVITNLELLAAINAHPAFERGEVDTDFIERHRADLFPDSQPAGDTVVALACIHTLLTRKAEARAAAERSLDPHSPWHLTDGWRLNADNHHTLYFRESSHQHEATVQYRRDGYLLVLAGTTTEAGGELDADGRLAAFLDGTRLTATGVWQGDELTLLFQGRIHRLTLHDPAAVADVGAAAPGSLTAPMPGRVVEVRVEPGQRVDKGKPLMILEAMKMEHTITAPAHGTVAKIYYSVSELVDDGVELLVFEPDE